MKVIGTTEKWLRSGHEDHVIEGMQKENGKSVYKNEKRGFCLNILPV